MSELRKCPECGAEETVSAPRCLCGHRFAPSPAEGQNTSEQGKRKPNLWLALIPGLVTVALTAGFALPRWFEFGRVAGAITGDAIVENSGGGSAHDRSKCVDVYAVTLKNSEFYVPENRIGAIWQKNAPRELSTVVQGMAANRCGEPLRKVRIRINVRGDQGEKGSGWASVGDLANGQAKAFERAWMGRVSSYEVAEIR